MTEPLEPPLDLARPARWACGCADCAALRAWLVSPTEQTWTFKGAEARRRHLESFLHDADVDRETSRRTNPHTLTCTKNTRSYQLRVAQRAADHDALRQLGA